MTYEELRNNEEVRALIKGGNDILGMLGSTFSLTVNGGKVL